MAAFNQLVQFFKQMVKKLLKAFLPFD